MILAIDQGTTGTTCLVFDREGRVAGRAYSEFEQHFPRPGWVEHDAAEIWEVTRRVAAEAIADAGIEGAELDGDRDHQPARDRRRLGPGDRRAAAPGAGLAGPAHRRALRASCARPGTSALVRERTGLVLDPYFSGTKIEWLLRNVEGAGAARSSARSTPGSSSSSPAATRPTTPTPRGRCSSTSTGCAWDEELCELLGVDPARLPEPLPVGLGLRDDRRVRRRGPGRGDRRRPAGGALRPGLPRARAWPRTPTGPAASSCSTPAPRRPTPADGLLTTVACGTADEPAYALEASIFVTGAAVQWLRDGLGIIERGRRDRGAGRLPRGQRRRLLRPRPDRARLAALGPLRARHDRRPHPRQRPRAPGARGAGGDRLPDGRRGRAPRRRPAASGSQCSRPTAAPSPTPG